MQDEFVNDFTCHEKIETILLPVNGLNYYIFFKSILIYLFINKFNEMPRSDIMNFIHENNKIYMNDENNHMIAVVTFPKEDGNTVNIDHTYVDGSLRGQGIAGKLMEETVKQLRENNLNAKLSCSYAVKWFEEHPEYMDLVVRNYH